MKTGPSWARGLEYTESSFSFALTKLDSCAKAAPEITKKNAIKKRIENAIIRI
jgi:hypothetical protein